MKPRSRHKNVSLCIVRLHVATPVLRSQTLISMNSVVFNAQMQWSRSNLPWFRQVIWIRPPNPATTNSQQRCHQNYGGSDPLRAFHLGLCLDLTLVKLASSLYDIPSRKWPPPVTRLFEQGNTALEDGALFLHPQSTGERCICYNMLEMPKLSIVHILPWAAVHPKVMTLRVFNLPFTSNGTSCVFLSSA